ncbi:MAG: type II toxin-antitoxin system VapC family toxin [Acidimicrobiia bacterium]
MAIYVDTSAFLKMVARETHSAAMRRFAEQNDGNLVSSDLMRTEAIRTARRHSKAALAETRSRLEVLTILSLTPEVFDRAAELDPDILRTLDALHVSSALSLGDELEGFVTYDIRMAEAAAIHGVSVKSPGAARK